MNFKKWNNYAGWMVWLVATVVYYKTMEPTVSLWDCGEYIATSSTLQVGHPPGAPTFNLIGRVFSAWAIPENRAFMVNFTSALSSSFTILFLFWVITHLVKKLAAANGEEFTDGKKLAVLFSGVIGALAYTFSDSFWFSAVEAEVYAMSSLCTAIVVWAIFRWEEVADEPGADRWIIFIMFIVGLSIGVHLLNLLTIPAMALIYYFRKYKQTKTKTFVIANIVGVFLLVLIQNILIPQLVSIPASFEKTFTNILGMPFNTGTYFFFLVFFSLIIFGLYYSHKKSKQLLHIISMSVLVVFLGYSSFSMILIRSQANTPIDENDPENLVNLLSYLNREQYGSWPILYGPYFNSELIGYEDGNPVYQGGFVVVKGDNEIKGFKYENEAKDYIAKNKIGGAEIKKKYFIASDRKNSEYKYKDEHCTVFPRMYSQEGRHVIGYKTWSGYDGSGDIRTINPRTGKTEALPTFSDNISYLVNYQIGWMYFRYFMWNFSGRQNDEQGVSGSPDNGNFITGINMIDSQLIGDQTKLPEHMKSKSRNTFFMLPLILGLIGLFWHFWKAPKDAYVVFLLFFFTGIAIVIYLNQKPFEPRERDYAYAASFYAFAMWIGIGVYALFDMARNLKAKDISKIAMPLGILIFVALIAEFIKGSEAHPLSISLGYIVVVVLILISALHYIGKSLSEKNLAIVIFAICIPVPYLMASEGWDDHNRSNRYFALALAKNYLEPCQKNAILFTHGDNDTFPLWYAQEVENIRTDVRVCNLSLLTADWYVDQMKRRAYESDPCPISFSEYLYRQGGVCDQVFIQQDPKVGYVDLKFALDSIKNEKNHILYSGRKLALLNTSKFYIKVDKDAVIANGIVPEEMRNEIVDTIKFSFPGGYIIRNSLMILDMIAHNDWKRPIYFGNTPDAETYCGLKDYLWLEGLNYKFVPIKNESKSGNFFGKVNTDVMYENLVEKFTWGNMDVPGIHVDYYSKRLTNNYRLQFLNLAEALVREANAAENKMRYIEFQKKIMQDSLSARGNTSLPADRINYYETEIKKLNEIVNEKLAKARRTIDRSLEVMPEENVPFDRIIPSIAATAFMAKYDSMAIKLCNRLIDIHDKNIDYYLSLGHPFTIKMSDEMGVSLRILMMISQVADDNKNEEISKNAQDIFNKQITAISTWAQSLITKDRSYAPEIMKNLPFLFNQPAMGDDMIEEDN